MENINITKMVKFDFEKLLKHFANMSDKEVMEEFAFVVNRIEFLETCFSSNLIDESTFFNHIEPLREAETYISRYLALLLLKEHGYDFDDSCVPILDIN